MTQTEFHMLFAILGLVIGHVYYTSAGRNMFTVDEMNLMAKYRINVQQHVHDTRDGGQLFLAIGFVKSETVRVSGKLLLETVRECVNQCKEKDAA